MTWLVHLYLAVTGAGNEAGKAYGFWSGFGGSIPDFLILGGLITLYRRHNCHVQGCPRLGRHQAGPYVVCRRHMPGGAPTAQQVIDAHQGSQS